MRRGERAKGSTAILQQEGDAGNMKERPECMSRSGMMCSSAPLPSADASQVSGMAILPQHAYRAIKVQVDTLCRSAV